MMAFHQDGDVETYLLTIMNMVSALYLDPTIGNFINIVVVRIILLEEDDAEVRRVPAPAPLLRIDPAKRAAPRRASITRDKSRFCPSKGWTSR